MENETSLTDKNANRIKPVVSGSAIPLRLQRSRKHKQVSPNGLPIVYVGRPTKWGNPFKVGEEHKFFGMIETVEKAVELYAKYINHQIKSGIIDINELRGKNLSCWCGETCLCHADILLELATKAEQHYR